MGSTKTPMFTRDGYFHRVQVTQAMCDAIAREVESLTGEVWKIEFTPTFWFRVLDNTDPARKRDYGWYENYDELTTKIRKLFPSLDLQTLTA